MKGRRFCDLRPGVTLFTFDMLLLLRDLVSLRSR